MPTRTELKVKTNDTGAKVASGTFFVNLGNDLKECVEMFGHEVVYERFIAAAKIAFQNQARTGLVNNESLETIQAGLDKGDLSATVRKVNAFKSIMDKVKSGEMTVEEATALIQAQLIAAKAEAAEEDEGEDGGEDSTATKEL